MYMYICFFMSKCLSIRPAVSYVTYAYDLLLSYCPASSRRGTKLVRYSARSPWGRCRNWTEMCIYIYIYICGFLFYNPLFQLVEKVWRATLNQRSWQAGSFRTSQWRMLAIAVGPPGPTGFDETSRILLYLIWLGPPRCLLAGPTGFDG
jgi:hypothetical protein